MRLLYGLLAATFVASATALEFVQSRDGWTKVDSPWTLTCRSSQNDPATSCSWDTPYGKHYPFGGKAVYAERKRLEHSFDGTDCILRIAKVEAKDDGVWACNVGYADESGQLVSQKAEGRLNIAQKPSSVVLQDPHNAEFVNVSGAELVHVKCVVEDAIPEPVFVWKIDDEILENAVTETESDGQTWTQTLTYLPRFEEHHNRSLICQANHIGFEEGDETEASTVIVFDTSNLDSQDLPGPHGGGSSGEANTGSDAYIVNPIVIVVIIAIIIVFFATVPALLYHFASWNPDRIQQATKAGDGSSNAPSGEKDGDEKSAAEAPIIGEAGDASEESTEKKTDDPEENRDETDEAETQVADDEADPNAGSQPALTLAQRLVSFFRLRNESSPKKLDEEDVESGADKEEVDNAAEKEDDDQETEKKDETKAEDSDDAKEKDETGDKVKKANVGRFSVWKLIKWPRAAGKKSEVDMEEGKEAEKEKEEVIEDVKEKAALEEEGEKGAMVELEPEDKPEPQDQDENNHQTEKKTEDQVGEPESAQDDNKKEVEPEPQSTPTKSDEVGELPSSPKTTPV